jgi:hypothetical protein
MSRPIACDVRVNYCGTVTMYSLITRKARAWVKSNVPDAIMLGNSLACEYRFVSALEQGMREAGLVVSC